jgi:hypothetical protein
LIAKAVNCVISLQSVRVGNFTQATRRIILVTNVGIDLGASPRNVFIMDFLN